MSQKNEKKNKKIIPLKWIFPDNLDTKYANNFIVNYDAQADTYQLSFFEAKSPLILAENLDARKKMVEQLESVDAVCVATIVISAKRIEAILDALKTNVERNIGSK